MRILRLLPIIFIASTIFAQPSFEWAIKYAKYRLIYEFSLEQDTHDVYLNISIPTNVIDNVLAYCNAIGKTHCDEAYPLVFFYNSTSQKQEFTADVEYVESYNGYPKTIRVHFDQLPAGNHYILIYYPYIWTDTFEDNPLEEVSATGSCLSDGYCLAASYNVYPAEIGITTSPFSETSGKSLFLYMYGSQTSSSSSYIMVEKLLDIPVNPQIPLLLSYNYEISAYYSNIEAALFVMYELSDGSNVSVRYTLYKDPYSPDLISNDNLNVCGTIKYTSSIGSPYHVTTNLFRDLSYACGISASKVSKIKAIYIGFAFKPHDSSPKYLYIDDLKFISKYT